MKPPRFDYIAPGCDDEVVDALQRFDGDARLLAGGQSLIPILNLRLARPAALIDLGRCPGLDELRRDGDRLICGPMVRQSAVEHSPLAAECCPLLAQTMPFIGSVTIRNRGTIGGTLAHADRIAELPAVAVALKAEMVAKGPDGTRVIPSELCVTGDLTTALAPCEMLREIRFPVSPPRSRSAFVEATNRHHDLAIVGIAAYVETEREGTCSQARLVAIGAASKPMRLRSAERVLAGTRLEASAIAQASRLAAADFEPEGDIHASARYRQRILPHLAGRALQQARDSRR